MTKCQLFFWTPCMLRQLKDPTQGINSTLVWTSSLVHHHIISSLYSSVQNSLCGSHNGIQWDSRVQETEGLFSIGSRFKNTSNAVNSVFGLTWVQFNPIKEWRKQLGDGLFLRRARPQKAVCVVRLNLIGWLKRKQTAKHFSTIVALVAQIWYPCNKFDKASNDCFVENISQFRLWAQLTSPVICDNNFYRLIRMPACGWNPRSVIDTAGLTWIQLRMATQTDAENLFGR